MQQPFPLLKDYKPMFNPCNMQCGDVYPVLYYRRTLNMEKKKKIRVFKVFKEGGELYIYINPISTFKQ